jgi:hypothetical protein
MKYRQFCGSDLKVSEVGFGLWTLSTGWWGDYTDEQAVRLIPGKWSNVQSLSLRTTNSVALPFYNSMPHE